MNFSRESRNLTARDGTRIAWHTHVDLEHEAGLGERSTLLLTNGLGTSENFWRHVVHVFARDHRVAHWDYRGHGASESSASDDYSIRAHADDLARVTEAAIDHGDGRTAPIHVAFSMGVAVLLELYRARPDLVRAMVLVGGAPDAPYANTLPFRVPGVLRSLRAIVRASAPLATAGAPLFNRIATSPVAYPIVRALGIVQPRAPRHDIDEFARTMAAMDPRAFWLSLHGLLGARGSDVLPTITVPVLVVAASHDTLVPQSQMDALNAALPSPHRAVIEESGHAVLVESGPEVCAAIRLFLRDHGLSTSSAA
jgi:pimeloyl-ACP methyl ester carboxylesterase